MRHLLDEDASSQEQDKKPPDTDVELVSKIWDETSRRREACTAMGWMDSWCVLDQYVLPLIAGPGSRGNWLEDIVRELDIRPDGYWLSLGCGAGGQEIYCVERGLCGRIDAYDISAESIAIANQNLRDKGLSGAHFQVGDFHEVNLPARTCDVVMMVMSLHHVADLNRLLPKIARTLKPGGWFLVNEYIGPAQFQFDDKQAQIVDELLDLLPDRLRFDYVHQELKHKYIRQSREHWFNVDPSESICSDRIESALHRYFHVVVQRDYGGTILNLLLEHIVDNFSADNEGDVLAVRLLGYLEQALIREEVLKNNFAAFAVKPKRGPMTVISLPYQLHDRLRIAWWRNQHRLLNLKARAGRLILGRNS